MKRSIFQVMALIGIVALSACSNSMGQSSLPPDDSAAAPQVQSGGDQEPFTTDAQGPIDDTPSADASSGVPVSTPATSSAKPSAAKAAAAKTAAQGSTVPQVAGAVQPAVRDICQKPAGPGRRECDAVVRTDLGAIAPNGYRGEIFAQAFPKALRKSKRCNDGDAPYCASDLQAAYGLTAIAKTGGKGAIVAIVDAFGYPNAAHDLAIYRKNMGLRPCAVASGCFKAINQRGLRTPLPSPNTNPRDDWRGEEALDVDMVSAICPNCKIVLVEANSNSNADLAAGVNAAAALGAVAISNSYGGPEDGASSAAYNHPGHAITASSGDSRTGPSQPCSYATVVCVGGTALVPASNRRGWNERAWSFAGSGCSKKVAKPAWQTDKGCTMRSEADIAAVADPNDGVAVYASNEGGWSETGGTSVSSPIVAAMFALGTPAARQNAPQWVWQHGDRNAYYDILQGSNGSCTIAYICHAGQGYDGPTGWGTANGIAGF